TMLELPPEEGSTSVEESSHDSADSASELGGTPPLAFGPSSSRGEHLPGPDQIRACLDANNGKLELAWRELGLKNRYVLRRLLAKYGLEVRRRSARSGL